MTQSQFDEFFSTDSISRKSALREILEDAINEFLRSEQSYDNFTWYFPDADENEVGTFEKYYDSNTGKVCIEIHYFDNTGFKNKRRVQEHYEMRDILEQDV